MTCGNRSSCKWIPPENEAYKANCDAMLDHGNRQMGIWVIIRNSGGKFGMDCGLALGIIETDEANVVKRLQVDFYLDSDFGLIIFEIIELKDKIREVTFFCTRKVANKVANNLALYALRINKDTYWMEDYPLCLANIVEADKPD
ncbi:hypothetical protein Dsin_000937 [Dipteronia sinensis]|uniref:RNase H type-1 domain-containing protein n=1 Tax=Dipteronia sinensis TaxID=43782 RepID=A0AAE0EHZ1_9ROSI|nr:hypothetical protein Dsin_000937 [Dipteronia sinensis]